MISRDQHRFSLTLTWIQVEMGGIISDVNDDEKAHQHCGGA
jgi:hypothetical protein